MKIDRPGASGSLRATGATGYARRADDAASAQGGLPITANASILGIPEAEFTPSVRDAIMTLMGEVEALRRELKATKTRLEDVERTADQDHLLPLLNRRAFVRELTRYIAYSDRYGTPASLIYFDLDDFKSVNDTYGHAAGDAVLMHFAERLTHNVRDTDIVGRLGGDEFGIILTHATQDQACVKADRLAETLKAAPPEWRGQNIVTTFSYGAFELKSGESAETAMARADEAMYAYKRGK